MHPITVRTMQFDVPAPGEFHPLCVAGNSILSYIHIAAGLYAAQLEPVIVKSMRRVLDQIRDEALREDLDRFVRQETQHYQRHIDFNNAVFAHDYPGLELLYEKLKQDADRLLTQGNDKYCIGFTAGFEAYITQFGLWILQTGLYEHRKTTRSIGELFKWHMLEEVEHRNVAHDVYQHLYGDYWYRARMAWVSQQHMVRFFNDCSQLMSSIDVTRYGESCRITPRQKIMLSASRFGMRARTMLPGYTPHNYVIPPQIAELSAHYTRIAKSTR